MKSVKRDWLKTSSPCSLTGCEKGLLGPRLDLGCGFAKRGAVDLRWDFF